jgi:hypothetical protein
MPNRTIELPKAGFAIEIDGRLKTEFATRESAERGAIEFVFRCSKFGSTTPTLTRDTTCPF